MMVMLGSLKYNFMCLLVIRIVGLFIVLPLIFVFWSLISHRSLYSADVYIRNIFILLRIAVHMRIMAVEMNRGCFSIEPRETVGISTATGLVLVLVFPIFA